MKYLKKILELFRHILKSGFLKSSIYVTLSKVFASACNLLFMIYAVNILSKTENGALQYYLGFFPVILALSEFGLPSAIVKFLAAEIDNKKRIGSILASSLWIKLFSLVFITLIGVVAWFFYDEDPLVIFILITGAFGFSFITFFESIFVSFRAYISLAIWNPLTNLTRLLVLYLTHTFSNSPLTYLDILTIFCISPIYTVILFFFVFPRDRLYWGASFTEIKKTTSELTNFFSWTILASIFAITSDRMEIFLINKYHPPEQVAIYGTTLQLFSGFLIMLSTLNSLVYPRLAALHGTNEFRVFLLKSLGIGILFAVVLSPGFFLAEPILNFLFNNKYSESIPIFKILYPNYLLQLVFAPFGIALFAMGKPKMLTFLSLLRLIAGYVLGNLLIPEFGVSGAGVSFFLGQIISWLVLGGYFWAVFWR